MKALSTLAILGTLSAVLSCSKSDYFPKLGVESNCQARAILNKTSRTDQHFQVFTQSKTGFVAPHQDYVWLSAVDYSGPCDSVLFVEDTVRPKTFPDVDIYFPDAFTPNNDGVNDEIKPTITGIPTAYYLEVYNRWGQRVFTTNHPGQAWDGYYNNKRQSDTYVYQVRARFFGDRADQFFTMMKRGHFSLIN